MALPSSGQISMSQINQELGRSSNAQISLDTAENGGYVTINVCSPQRPSANNPATMSEWRGYDHSALCYNESVLIYSTQSLQEVCDYDDFCLCNPC